MFGRAATRWALAHISSLIMFWTYRQRLNSSEIVRTNMKRLCGFAVSHIITHYYAASRRVAWSVGLSVALLVCHTSEPCKNGWNDQVAICVLDSSWPNEPSVTWGPDANMGRNNFEGETDKPYRDTLRSSVQTQQIPVGKGTSGE